MVRRMPGRADGKTDINGAGPNEKRELTVLAPPSNFD